MSVVEEFSGIDVDDMLRKKKQFFGHAFAYVFDLGFPLEFVVDSETYNTMFSYIFNILTIQ